MSESAASAEASSFYRKIGIAAGLFLGAHIAFAPFIVVPYRYGLPYAGTRRESLEAVRSVLLLSRKRLPESKASFVDLGCGTSHLLVEASRCGFRSCRGIEVNPLLFGYSVAKLAAHRVLGTGRSPAGDGPDYSIHRGDMFAPAVASFRLADVIHVYGVPALMARIADTIAADVDSSRYPCGDAPVPAPGTIQEQGTILVLSNQFEVVHPRFRPAEVHDLLPRQENSVRTREASDVHQTANGGHVPPPSSAVAVSPSDVLRRAAAAGVHIYVIDRGVASVV